MKGLPSALDFQQNDIVGYIYILPFGNIPGDMLNYAKRKIETNFINPVKIMDTMVVPPQAFDPKRKQYLSTAILKTIIKNIPEKTEKIVGITSLDLFVPILTFVYGQAQLDGKAAIVSYHRLKQNFYGLPEDYRLLKNRFGKEIIHELGHTYGLVHCSDNNCVMHFANSIMHVDIKEDKFCETCTNILTEKL